MNHLFPVLLLLGLAVACKNEPDAAANIQKLEAEIAQNFDFDKAKNLVTAYREAVKKYPDRHADNLRYLTQAADIQYFKFDDATSACRWLDDALAHHAEGKNLTDAVKLYSQIWNAYIYKAAPIIRLDPVDIDKMKAHLMRNTIWIDSALVRLDKKIVDSFSTGLDKNACKEFIDISEAYANLMENRAPEKYFDLMNRAAALAKTAEQPKKAIALYEVLLQLQPNAPKAAQVAFMMAYIHENDLQDLETAKKTYQYVIKNYPKDADMVANAKLALKNLGKTPEQILKEAGALN